MSAKTKDRGLKRICADCGTRYYDFNARPIVCPSCNAAFSAEVKVKGRRGRSASGPANDETALAAKNKPAEKAAALKENKNSADSPEMDDEDDLEEDMDIDIDLVIDEDDDEDDDDLSEDIKIEIDEEKDS